MRRFKREINFFALAGRPTQAAQRGKLPPMAVYCAAASLVLVLCLWAAFSLLDRSAVRQIETVNHTLGGITAPIEISGPDMGIGGLTLADIVALQQEHANKNLLTTDALQKIFAAQPADLSIRSAAYSSDGTLSLSCLGESELCGADFAKLLRESDAGFSVQYTGVSACPEGYEFTIAILLGEGGAAQ